MVDPLIPASERQRGRASVDIMNQAFNFEDPTWKALVRDGLLLYADHNIAFAGQHANFEFSVGGKKSDVSETRQEEIKAIFNQFQSQMFDRSPSALEGRFEFSVKLHSGLSLDRSGMSLYSL